MPLSTDGPGRTPSNVLPGSWLCDILEEVGLLHTMVRTILIYLFYHEYYDFISLFLYDMT